jgi:hypothetical protein
MVGGMKTEPRTAAATRARRQAAIRRRITRAAALLREQGWIVTPPAGWVESHRETRTREVVG